MAKSRSTIEEKISGQFSFMVMITVLKDTIPFLKEIIIDIKCMNLTLKDNCCNKIEIVEL